MGKRITDSQILGELGVALIKTRVLRMGFTWHPSNAPVEAGIDGWIELRDRNTGEVANCWLPVQSRARSNPERETDRTVSYTCKQKDLEYWMKGTAPVLLVVSKPDVNEAWWVSVKDYFQNKDFRKDRRIVFDRESDRFDESAADQLKALGNRYGSGAYFTPARREETLISNLLRVSDWADDVYHAETPYRKPEDLQARLKEFVEWPPREWMLKDGLLYSFHNLADEPWCQVCDTQTINTTPTKEWANADPGELQRNFIRLLNQCLRDIAGRWFMVYTKDEECFHFKRTRDLKPRKVFYKSHRKKTSRVVFRPYKSKADPERIAYYRHDGFSHRFRRYDAVWYLEITPTYVFTKDGKEPDPYREERLAKIKTIEGDGAVAGRVLMFADILRDKKTMFDKPYPFLTFGELVSAPIPVGINDEAWSKIKPRSKQVVSQTADQQTEGSMQGTLFDT